MKRLFYFLNILAVAILLSAGCGRTPKDGIHTVTVCSTTDLHGAYFGISEGSLSVLDQAAKEFRSVG